MSDPTPEAPDPETTKRDDDRIKRVGARLVTAFRAQPLSLATVQQAALLASVMLYDLGATDVDALTTAEVNAKALAFRRENPLAWAAVLRENAHGVVHGLAAHLGDAHFDAPEFAEEYDALVALVRP